MTALDLIGALDLRIERSFAAFLGRAPTLDGLVAAFLENDLVKGGLLLALTWWVWHQPDDDQASRRQILVATLVGAALAALVSRTLCHLLPPRPRPFAAPWLGAGWFPPRPLVENDSSFPSDHAALAFGLATGFLFLSRRLGVALFCYVSLFVCLPRLYLGVHWPSDVVAGALIGTSVTAPLCTPRVRAQVARAPFWVLSRSRPVFYTGMFLVSFLLMTRFEAVRGIASWAWRAFRGTS